MQNNQQQQRQPLQTAMNCDALSNLMEDTWLVPLSSLNNITENELKELFCSIITRMTELARSKSNAPATYALFETYSRVLTYSSFVFKIDRYGVKKIFDQLLPIILDLHAWEMMQMLLEMFSYRIHNYYLAYKDQLLLHLYNLPETIPQINNKQFHLCVESTALHIISEHNSTRLTLNSLEYFIPDPKVLVSPESEELNKAWVLVLARLMCIEDVVTDGNSLHTWSKKLLDTIMQNTPHSWSTYTLQWFPPMLKEFFQRHNVVNESAEQIKNAVDEEYEKWKSMNDENNMIAYFSAPSTPPLFLCLLWRTILDTDRIDLVACKILEIIGTRARALLAHLRKFCDYLLLMFSNIRSCDNPQQFFQYYNKYFNALNDIIWKYNIVTIDRLILCLLLRTQEGEAATFCIFIIETVLLIKPEFRIRVKSFVETTSPKHWELDVANWYFQHLAFHKHYPEKFEPENVLEQRSDRLMQYRSLSVFCGNVCLRFLPVFDIVLHRCLELNRIPTLERLLECLGCLYKFHNHPVAFLYNTLYYYERMLRDQPTVKCRLVSGVLSTLQEIIPSKWALSKFFEEYMYKSITRDSNDTLVWMPDCHYYFHLVHRLVETLSSSMSYAEVDWRFNEFVNPQTHMAYMTCVELMALPVAPNVVVNSLFDIIAKRYIDIPEDKIDAWIHSVGRLLATLPECYWSASHDRLVDTINKPDLICNLPYDVTLYSLFADNVASLNIWKKEYCYILSLATAGWEYVRVERKLAYLQYIKEKLQPIVNNEEQLIYVYHFIAILLKRFNTKYEDDSDVLASLFCSHVIELTVSLYEMLERVDHNQAHLKYIDAICESLFNVRIMVANDSITNKVKHIIQRIRPELQTILLGFPTDREMYSNIVEEMHIE